jgi:hypothetical protein
VDAIERRSAWVAITLAIVLAFAMNGFALVGTRPGNGELAVFLAGIFSLGLSAAFLVLALVPDVVRPFSLAQRARFVYVAFVLVVVAILTAVGLHAHYAIDLARHPQS